MGLVGLLVVERGAGEGDVYWILVTGQELIFPRRLGPGSGSIYICK